MSKALDRIGKDRLGGALMVLIGLGAVAKARAYEIGTLRRMGAGYFPAALGAVLALAGLLMMIRAKRAGARLEARVHRPQWGPWLLIVASLVAFVVAGRFGGLVPASFAVVFVASLADRENGVRTAIWFAAAMTAISVVVFHWALQLQFPLFQWG